MPFVMRFGCLPVWDLTRSRLYTPGMSGIDALDTSRSTPAFASVTMLPEKGKPRHAGVFLT